MLTWLLKTTGELMLFGVLFTLMIGGFRVIMSYSGTLTELITQKITDYTIQRQMKKLRNRQKED